MLRVGEDLVDHEPGIGVFLELEFRQLVTDPEIQWQTS